MWQERFPFLWSCCCFVKWVWHQQLVLALDHVCVSRSALIFLDLGLRGNLPPNIIVQRQFSHFLPGTDCYSKYYRKGQRCFVFTTYETLDSTEAARSSYFGYIKYFNPFFWIQLHKTHTVELEEKKLNPLSSLKNELCKREINGNWNWVHFYIATHRQNAICF